MENFQTFKEISIETEAARSNRNIDNICRYGINILDQYLGGILENELVVIGAASGIGKTELSGMIAVNNAMRGKKIALLSLEGDKGEIFYRYAQKEINLKRKAQGRTDFIKGPEFRLNLSDVQAEVQEVIKNMPPELENLTIFDKTFIPDAKKLVELMMKNYKEVDMFVIDHLHYLDYGSEERAGITDIVQKVKEMTELMNTPVVLVSHLRRLKTPDQVPTKSDLHGSSNIEKNANTVILLSPEVETDYVGDQSDATYLRGTRIIVDKNRSGVPVPLMLNVTFDLRTKEYLEGNKYEYLSPDEKNKGTIHDKLFD